jgi:phosphate transport system substrate-binding protein
MFAKCRILLGLVMLSATFAAHADITGAGSSAAKPLYNLWAEEYAKSGNPKLNYQPVGSSAGIKQIKEHSVDFGASDVAMSLEDRKTSKMICFPSAISGVVPIVNLPGIKAGELQMTGEVLADIFARKVTKWNDPEIAAINPGLALPKLPIVAVVRSDGSGTTYNFTDYLAKMSRPWKDGFGHNFTITWPADATPVKGSGGVVTAVKQTSGAIGYVDYNYVVQEKLTYTKVQNRDGKFVAPNAEAFESALSNSSWKTQATFEEMLTDKAGARTWPITMGTFVIVPQVTNDPDRTTAALQFFTWAFLKGDKLVGNIDFVRLPDRVQARIYSEMTQITDTKGQPLHLKLQ